MTRDHALWDVSESLGYVKVDSEQLKFLKACNPAYNELTPGVALLANSALADKCTHKCQENGEEKGCKVNRVENYPVGDRTYGVAQQWYPHMCDPEKNEGFVHLKSLLSWDNYKARVKKSNQDRTMTNQWTWACFGCSINPKEPVSLDWAKYAHANLDHRRKKMDQYMIVDLDPWDTEFVGSTNSRERRIRIQIYAAMSAGTSTGVKGHIRTRVLVSFTMALFPTLTLVEIWSGPLSSQKRTIKAYLLRR
jgi:hypothetical protein